MSKDVAGDMGMENIESSIPRCEDDINCSRTVNSAQAELAQIAAGQSIQPKLNWLKLQPDFAG